MTRAGLQRLPAPPAHVQGLPLRTRAGEERLRAGGGSCRSLLREGQKSGAGRVRGGGQAEWAQAAGQAKFLCGMVLRLLCEGSVGKCRVFNVTGIPMNLDEAFSFPHTWHENVSRVKMRWRHAKNVANRYLKESFNCPGKVPRYIFGT